MWFKKYRTIPSLTIPAGWCIDCLKKSGLLRIFCNKNLHAGLSMSSFDLFSIEKIEENK